MKNFITYCLITLFTMAVGCTQEGNDSYTPEADRLLGTGGMGGRVKASVPQTAPAKQVESTVQQEVTKPTQVTVEGKVLYDHGDWWCTHQYHDHIPKKADGSLVPIDASWYAGQAHEKPFRSESHKMHWRQCIRDDCDDVPDRHACYPVVCPTVPEAEVLGTL